MRQLPQPWMAGMEATLFTGWNDHLVSGSAMVKVAHPAMLQAIAAGKKKNDRVDARKIADLLRCDYSRNATWNCARSGTEGECCATAICW